MNNLRTPVILLAVVVVALIAWFVWAHEQASATTPAQTLAIPASSTTAAQTSAATSGQNYPGMNYPPLQTVQQNIAGSWQSTDDPNYSVAITSGGEWTDSYLGANASSSTSEAGTYELFTSQNPDKDFTGTLVPGVVYVKVSEGSSVLYFSVLGADGTHLQLSYLDRGTTLSFVKMQ